MAGLAPPSGDTSGSRGDAGAGGGQAYRRHTGCHLHWGGQPQKGDVIVEVLGVVVGVSDGLGGGMSIMTNLPRKWLIQVKDYIFTKNRKLICVVVWLTLEMDLT